YFVVLIVVVLRMFHPYVGCKLPHIKFTNHYFLVLSKDLSSIARQRAYIVEMSKSQLPAFLAKFINSRRKVSIGASPADDQQVGVFITLNLKFRDKIGYTVNLFLAKTNHILVIYGIMRDYSCKSIFFKSTNAMFISFHSRPNPCTALLFHVSQIWFEFPGALSGMGNLYIREIFFFRHPPTLC